MNKKIILIILSVTLVFILSYHAINKFVKDNPPDVVEKSGNKKKVKTKYLPLIIKIQINNPKPTDNAEKSKFNTLLEEGLSAMMDGALDTLPKDTNIEYSDNPDLYFIMRIDGVESPFINSTIHQDCLGRAVNQSIMYESKYKGRRAIVEFWNSNDDSLLNKVGGVLGSLDAEVEGNVGVTSAAVTVDGMKIGDQLKACSTYIGQCEVILGHTVGQISAITDGSTIKKDIAVEIVRPFEEE
jgi:hypothetical protein